MLVYNMTLKFESEIFVSCFDKDFEQMINQFGGSVNGFGNTVKLEHSVDISNVSVLPDDNFINIIKNNIHSALVTTFEQSSSMNAKVIAVEYIGITKINQKTIEENNNDAIH